ncbi:uncharacterized protein LOC107466015 isoform X5 [Arachis duranensis]|uniref:Pectin acetylesterase n=1 Tax=Arachis duranensis TaxID=130453 RepID=A0A9C6WM72_ARADU|nr:uncharacterized protein LOC107466015 isoform X5 [Arachis duranensis]
MIELHKSHVEEASITVTKRRSVFIKLVQRVEESLYTLDKRERKRSTMAMASSNSANISAIHRYLTVTDFYNWNIIKVRHCDGSLFTGDIEAVDPISNSSRSQSQMHFRCWLFHQCVSPPFSLCLMLICFKFLIFLSLVSGYKVKETAKLGLAREAY